jgi:hypothetical protein
MRLWPLVCSKFGCRTGYSACLTRKSNANENHQAEQLAEKPLFLSFRGALRAEESLFSCV